MWIFIVLAVIGLIVLLINKDYKKNVKESISNQGGMMVKYASIIDYLKSDGMSLQNVSEDSVTLSSKSMKCSLDYVGNNLEVRMKGVIPMFGSIDKRWTFSDGYPQNMMIEEIENYLTWEMDKIKSIVQNNPYQHLNK